MRIVTKLAMAAAMVLVAAPAVGADAPLQVSYPTDAQLDCPGIGAEVGRVDGIIAEANKKIAGADGSAKGAGLAGTVAVEGLMRSGMLARAPGLGMFANQASNMARQNAERTKAVQAQQIQTAETRKALLAGLWSGKGCDAPQPVPVAAPAAPAEPAPAPAAS